MRSAAIVGAARLRRAGARLLLVGVCLVPAGCAAFGPHGVGPDGLAPWDSDLRRLTATGAYGQAMEATGPQAGKDAGDELLRLLQRGAVAHYAGEYEESNRVLQAAELEVEERWTKSVSRAALSLLANDRVLAYVPPLTERLMIHYYGALNYLALGQSDEAAVEARRLSGLLERTDDADYDGRERSLRSALRYFAGCVFEAAGERTDAEVAYRNAFAGWGPAAETRLRGLVPVFLDTLPPPDSATAGTPSLPPPPGVARPTGTGEVIVLLESGFVAHRVEATLAVPVYAEEVGHLGTGAAERRYDAGLCAAWRALEDRPGHWSAPGGCATPGGEVTEVLTLAWPAMRRSPDRLLPGSVVVAPPVATQGQPAAETAAKAEDEEPSSLARGATVDLDVSGAVVAEFEDRVPGILAKSVARAVAKLAIVGAVTDEVKEDDKTLGEVLDVVGVVAVAASERADTRSWHLLPSSVRIVRLRLPAGPHRLRAEVGRTGRVGTREVDLGEVNVQPGRLRLVSTRIWP